MRASNWGASGRLALSAAALSALFTAVGATGVQSVGAATVHGTAAVRPIHQTRCTRTTFQVSYRVGQASREKCYEGVGRIRPDIRNVRLIRTGNNAGSFTVRACTANEFVIFQASQVFPFHSVCPVTLETLDITRA
jgi:hypothetical protein